MTGAHLHFFASALGLRLLQRDGAEGVDAALPDRPVIMTADDHHTARANTSALEKAGLLHGAHSPDGTAAMTFSGGVTTWEA